MRKQIAAANWKMNCTYQQAEKLLDDVLNAINNNGKADVLAVAEGNSFRLIDNSGGTGNLKVQEVGAGKTALDLGLAGINVAANSATGATVQKLHATTRLASRTRSCTATGPPRSREPTPCCSAG